MNIVLGITHRTAYTYDAPVRLSYNEARLEPLSDARQFCLSSRLSVWPESRSRYRYRDYFGTQVEAFEVLGAHDSLEVVAEARVALPQLNVWVGPAALPAAPPGLHDLEFNARSPLVQWNGEIGELAAGLRRDDPRETAERIIAWLRSQLTYERGTTSVDTPVDEVLRRGRGVCQDYAHLGCALLRAAGLAARYVSGYYTSRQLAVGEAAVGEGHAWLEVLLPPLGWVGYDPTNACPPNAAWIKVGHGRDYRDVLPLHGVYFGNAGQQMQVSVTIERLPDWLGGQ